MLPAIAKTFSPQGQKGRHRTQTKKLTSAEKQLKARNLLVNRPLKSQNMLMDAAKSIFSATMSSVPPPHIPPPVLAPPALSPMDIASPAAPTTIFGVPVVHNEVYSPMHISSPHPDVRCHMVGDAVPGGARRHVLLGDPPFPAAVHAHSAPAVDVTAAGASAPPMPAMQTAPAVAATNPVQAQEAPNGSAADPGAAMPVDRAPIHKLAFSSLGTSSKRAIISRVLPQVEAVIAEDLQCDGRSSDAAEVASVVKEVADRTYNAAFKKRGGVTGTSSEWYQNQLAESPIMRGLLQSYCRAPPDSEARQRILSSVCTHVQFKRLNSLLAAISDGESISRYEFTLARRRAAEYGAGNIPSRSPAVRHRTSVTDKLSLDYGISFVQQFLQPLAHLTRTVVLSTGERMVIPSILLSVPADEIIALYYDSFRQSSDNDTSGVTQEVTPPTANALEEEDTMDSNSVADEIDEVAPAGAAAVQPLCKDHFRALIHTLSKIRYDRLSYFNRDRGGTDLDIIKCACVDATQCHASRASLSVMESRHRSEPQLVSTEELDLGFLFDNQTRVDTSMENVLPALGFGYSHTGAVLYKTAKIMEFVLFAQGRGDRSVGGGTKSHPGQCVRAMEALGTPAGEEVFTETAADRERMARTPDSHRVFGIHECLNAQQWKGQLATPRINLQASYDRLVKAEENAAANAASPLRAAVMALRDKATIKRKYTRLCVNHEIEAAERPARAVELHLQIEANNFGAYPRDLKPLLYELVLEYGSIAADVALFI